MEIKPGRYRTKSDEIIVIERKINSPVPFWKGYLEGYSKDRGGWTDDGRETSGHQPWTLIERIEEVGRKES